jgi:hypothetical protein
VTAAANPRTATAPVTDHAFRVASVLWARTKATATATASAVCPGCAGKAVTVQVLYLHGSSRMKLDNVAVAWTQGCDACRATAVSLQVAVVSGSGTLVPSNRALALNAACAGCAATSAAYQVVVVGSRSSTQSRLSPTALRTIREWAAARARLLRQGTVSSPSRSLLQQDRALQALAVMVNTQLGTRTATVRTRLADR